MRRNYHRHRLSHACYHYWNHHLNNVAFRPLLSRVTLHPVVPPTDIITLYIPAQVDEKELGAFGRQIHSFHTSFAHVSHDPPKEMLSANRGWSQGLVERGENGVKMMVHVLLDTWKSKGDELRFKNEGGGKYESMFLRPMREVEGLGVEYEEEQVLLEPVSSETAKEGKSCCGSV